MMSSDMKSAGIHLLNYWSFRHTQQFSFLDKSTGPILPFVVLPLWILVTQGCFVPSLVKISPLVLEKKILKYFKMYFRCFIIISPWKDRALHLRKKNESPSSRILMSSLVKFGLVILERKRKMGKVYNDNNDAQWKNCDQKSSFEPLAQVN